MTHDSIFVVVMTNLGVSLIILGFLFTQHKIWVRLKDRVNTLWARHCEKTGDQYTPVDNGGK